MRLKYLALTCLLIFTVAISSPPRLGWEYGWCWDNALVQLLYNMRGLTECLIKNAGECRQKNRVLEKYIDLITAIRKNPDGYFIEEMRAYHAAFCGARGCTMCTWSIASVELSWLLEDYFYCCRELFEMKIKNVNHENEELSWSLFLGSPTIGGPESYESVSDVLEGNKGQAIILTLPPYFLLPVDQAGGIANEYIDLAPLLSDELKKTHKTCPYELIGVGIQGSHVTAYIKDQWEAHPSWYYCDDMAARNLPSHQKIDKWPESGPWPGKVSLLVYKRVDTRSAKKPIYTTTFAGAKNKPQDGGDDKDLENLVQALRDLIG